MMKAIRFILLALVMGVALGAHAAKKPKKQTVYIFGFSASFTDSVAFLTDVMQLDSAYIMHNGFLADRSLYSLQLENYVLGKCQVLNSTNAVFFSTKRKEVEKKYNKVNRMYQHSEGLALIFVGEDEFRFQPQEYIESVVIDSDAPAEAASRKDDEASGDASASTGGKK